MMALIGPARLFGYQFEDFELLQEMTQAVENENSALALLQFCANKMWDRRDRHRRYLTRDSYDQLGGVGGALAVTGTSAALIHELNQPIPAPKGDVSVSLP